jgi:hypothetical protein
MYERISAVIRFLTTSEGGRFTAAMDGVRPQLKLGEIFTSCIVHGRGPNEPFELGVEYRVTLELVFLEKYGGLLSPSTVLALFEGNRLVATGRLIEG